MEEALASLVQAILSGLAIGCLYTLIALGYNLTYVVNGTVNMGQGQLVMIGAMLMVTFTTFLDLPFFIALILVGLILGILGILLEVISVRKFVQDKTSVNWVLSTLAVGIILQDLALFIWGPEETRLVSPVGEGMFEFLGAGIYWKELMMIPAVGVFLLLLMLFYLKSHWGLWLRATADNKVATNLNGVNSNYTVAIAFGLSALLAGLAGGLITPIYAVFASMGLSLGLKAIAVAIVAGLNNAKGIVICGLGLGIVEVLVAMYISPGFREMIVYIVVILILFIKPNGLFGTKETIKV
ncbi:branched-chain amino acid ABC transporter permease [Peribacillus cavernae]|uniref:Branched-chain amino acid ABC transporter permease n=1 Tax=Peribacillus cavernae TaxID=1674310 RepID=A0A433HIJ7_9BACI|nr:branched-chain amino acid ABC transporter permease [Peribacillus cavernae]MDQ0217729.1 branched-chain amino acid transport system permease protein [Peribacillus cavernae]RUQ28194.1 branched-chain amino acid ABC transporter permease [Peribacillus cavernae]